MSKNPLGALPDSIAKLASLVTLNSSNCGLSALPSSLGNRNLAVLNAAGNSISVLPASLANCSALIKLDLQNNCLQVGTARVPPDLVPQLCITTMMRPLGPMPQLPRLAATPWLTPP